MYICLYMRFIIPLLLFSVSTLAQKPKHYIGVNLNPSFTNAWITDEWGREVFLNDLEVGRGFIGGSVGISGLIDLGSRLDFQMDILYGVYTIREKFKPRNATFPDLAPGPTFQNIGIDEYHMLSIPLLLNYYLNDPRAKWSWYVSGGVRGHGLITIFRHFYTDLHLTNVMGSPIDIQTGRSKIEDVYLENYRRLNLSAQVGIGVDYRKSQHLKFRLATNFEHFLLKTYKNDDFFRQGFIYAIGLNLGIYWRL